jgi:hypothetical protein
MTPVPPPDEDLSSLPERLELEVGHGVDTEFRRLITASEHWAAVISDVARLYLGSDSGVKWIVEAESGSVRLLLRPEAASVEVRPSAVAQLPDVVAGGVAQLQREAIRPEFFSDRALERLSELAALAGDGLPLAVRNGHEQPTSAPNSWRTWRRSWASRATASAASKVD